MDDADDPILQRQLQRLDDLAGLGLDVARAVAARAQEADARSSSPTGDRAANLPDIDRVAMAYARVSRAVRLTIMLQSKLMGELKAARRAAADREERSQPAYVHKARVERIVERIAQQEHGDDEDEIDRLVFEAGERLDDEDVYGDILDRPIAELVALVCRDLGLEPDWSRLAQEAWMQEEECARPPPLCGGGGPRRGGGGSPLGPFGTAPPQAGTHASAAPDS